MNRLLLAVAVGGLIVMTSCAPLADDTPVVVGDSGSAVIGSKPDLSEYTDVTAKIKVHPDGKRKWSNINVTYAGQTATHKCTTAPCQVSLEFDTGFKLSVYTKTTLGLVIDSSEDFNTYRKDPNNNWVQAGAGHVARGSIQIGRETIAICPGAGCRVSISYMK